MIVYGDPSYHAALPALVARLRERAHRAAASPPSLDALRALLIEAGQVEQAARDAVPALPAECAATLLPGLESATDHSAIAFVRRWRALAGAQGPAEAALQAVASALEWAGAPPDLQVEVKVPEGYAFYTLFPEQYVLAAERWAAEHQSITPRRVLVIGIRSIGTSLSAAVSAGLVELGWEVRRLTVRPTGHPFDRQVHLAPTETVGTSAALIVDEGPGLSGSSVAAVVRALIRAGLDPAQISVLPGHDREPGEEATVEVRALWAGLRRYTARVGELRWSGRTLAEHLADLTTGLCNGADVVRIDDLSAGAWRAVIYGDSRRWPPACTAFERVKLRCSTRSRQAVLWKFAGLAGAPRRGADHAEAVVAELAARAQRGWTPPPIAAAFGFVAQPWVDGEPLTRSDGQSELLAHVGRYLADVAGPPLPPEEASAAFARLRLMVWANVEEALGEAQLAQAHPWADVAAEALAWRPWPTYGDGHLAPHEWLRTSTGQVLKVDAVGHDVDHTVIGPQPVLWDLAGALVEWALEGTAAAALIDAARGRLGEGEIPAGALRFYRLAYAAFRMGQCGLCAQTLERSPSERARLRCAQAYYRADVIRQLDAGAT